MKIQGASQQTYKTQTGVVIGKLEPPDNLRLKGQCNQQLDEMCDLLDKLAEKLSRLEDKLEPVLAIRPSDPTPKGVEVQQNLVPLAGRIREAGSRIDRAITAVARITDTVEL